MNRYYRAAGLFVISLFFFQCQKDVSFIGNPDPGIPNVVLPDPIKATLQGNITDENNKPAAGVGVTVGSATAVTDGSGYFRFTDAALDKNTSLVTAEKPGYFKGYRVFSATAGTNQIFIKLIKKTLAGIVTASSGGTATLPNGIKISLPAGGVVTALSGSAYSGNVNVYAAYIDPSAGDIAQTVPGSFVATNKNGKRVVLSSYGMLAVELESTAGEKLQIKAGSVASLTTPIPSSVLAAAPSSIAMWSVDDKTGIWKEEGTATKQGNNYVGDVKHFSFWNCDYPFDAVTLSLTVQTGGKMPLTYATVRVTKTSADSGAYSTYGYTDSLGQVKGYVPSNANLLVEVLDPCGVPIYSQSLPPLTQHKDLGVVIVSNATNSILTYKGRLLDCNAMPVTNGFALIKFNDVRRYALTDALGKFATTFIICPGTPATSELTGVDVGQQQQSTNTIVPITTTVTDAGDIATCGTSTVQYLNYTLDGVNFGITNMSPDSLLATTYPIGTGETETYFEGSHNRNLGSSITFTVRNISAPGTVPIHVLYPNLYNPITIIRPFDVTFTSFANTSGEFYEGSFAGQFSDSLTGTHNISSTFRVRRY